MRTTAQPAASSNAKRFAISRLRADLALTSRDRHPHNDRITGHKRAPQPLTESPIDPQPATDGRVLNLVET